MYASKNSFSRPESESPLPPEPAWDTSPRNGPAVRHNVAPDVDKLCTSMYSYMSLGRLLLDAEPAKAKRPNTWSDRLEASALSIRKFAIHHPGWRITWPRRPLHCSGSSAVGDLMPF